MDTAPPFFIPRVSPESQEDVYSGFAESIGHPTPELGRRVFSIVFRHDGVEWTATVGQVLHGTRHKARRHRGVAYEHTSPVSDSATVLAVFAGNPYFVFTDSGLAVGSISSWVNPFMAGRPIRTVHFSY